MKKLDNEIAKIFDGSIEKVDIETLLKKVEEKYFTQLVYIEPSSSHNLEDHLSCYVEKYNSFQKEFDAMHRIYNIFKKFKFSNCDWEKMIHQYLSLKFDVKKMLLCLADGPDVDDKTVIKINSLLKMSKDLLSIGDMELIFRIFSKLMFIDEDVCKYFAVFKQIKSKFFSNAPKIVELYSDLQQGRMRYIDKGLAEMLIQMFSSSEEMTKDFQTFISNNNLIYQKWQAQRTVEKKPNDGLDETKIDQGEEDCTILDVDNRSLLEEQKKVTHYYNLLMGCENSEQLMHCFPKCGSNLYYSIPKKVFTRLQLELEECNQLLTQCQTMEEQQFLEDAINELSVKQVLLSEYLKSLGIAKCKIKAK